MADLIHLAAIADIRDVGLRAMTLTREPLATVIRRVAEAEEGGAEVVDFLKGATGQLR